ncbi:MAG TPA: 3-hydroxyisobutyrate dehydrogenase, partial [Acinetobacter radioresistens]|nr:3-hydroxyisobutyrate dehydrogenase [Acinetobacter radioresistens]
TQTIMPVLQLTQQLYRSASNNLPSESDFSSVVQQLEQWNNLTLQSA